MKRENDVLENSMFLQNAAKLTCREKSHDVSNLSLKVKEYQLNILKNKRQNQTNPSALSVGMQIGTATMKNSTEFP